MSDVESCSSSSSSLCSDESHDTDCEGATCCSTSAVTKDFGALPYQYEPPAPNPPRSFQTGSGSGAPGPDDPHANRVGTNDWYVVCRLLFLQEHYNHSKKITRSLSFLCWHMVSFIALKWSLFFVWLILTHPFVFFSNSWYRCQCGRCVPQTQPETSFCCRECPELDTVRKEPVTTWNKPHPDASEVTPHVIPECVTEHHGLRNTGTDVHVLRAAYNANRRRYGQRRRRREQPWTEHELRSQFVGHKCFVMQLCNVWNHAALLFDVRYRSRHTQL